MSQPIRSIPIEHHPMSYEIDAHPRDVEQSLTYPEQSLTLLELVQAVNEVSESEQELIATVLYMLQSGRIRPAGIFRETGLDAFRD